MKRRPFSLTQRLTVSIGAVMTVVLLTFGWIVEKSINDHFAQQDVDELNAIVISLRASLSQQQEQEEDSTLKRRLATAISGHHNAQFYISDTEGHVIYATPNSNLDSFAEATPPVGRIDVNSAKIWHENDQIYRGAVVILTQNGSFESKPLRVAVATSINFHLHYLDSFRNYLKIIMIVACLIAVLATWIAVYQGHAPLRRISREIRRIKSDQLYIRLDPNSVPVELTELAVSFNDMLKRLEDGFKRLSNFSADIAHELRTPITNLKTQTEVVLSQGRNIDQYREILYSNLEEYESMAKMVGDMLFLAQADNNQLKLTFTEINLATEIHDLFDYFEAWAEEKSVSMQLTGDAVFINGDRRMIRRALSNLISNAIGYTPAGYAIKISIGSRVDVSNKEIAIIRVENPSAVIDSEHLPRLFDRFYRVDPSRQHKGGGAGLGLAIVKSIIEGHGGVISVYSRGDNLIFEIQIPKYQV